VLASAAPRAIRADGHILHAHVQPFFGATQILDIGSAIRPLGGAVSRRGRARCLSAAGRPAAVQFSGRTTGYGPGMYAALRYTVVHASRRPAAVTSRSRGVEPTYFPLDRPSGEAVFELADPITIHIPAGAEVCARSLLVGWLVTQPLH
jgi:hypothetical protein